MRIVPTAIPEVLAIEPAIYRDERGYFLQTWHRNEYGSAGIPTEFVQDSVSRSVRGVLRGLHFQNPNAQGKIVTATAGAVFDVVVDVRRGSPTFGKWVEKELSSDNRVQLWIPPGFAHGFCVLSESADLSYKFTAHYDPAGERCIRWDDPELGIAWPVADPIVSPKDRESPRLRDCQHLPEWS
ncbi:MAG: dTDP-4-dehydrorhamnose 3,5-epimerase [Pseudomonadota bacterium]